ncbi:MAG: FecR domain-containing protein [Burkholderiales bacterium]|nr:FecR domain-containing protein [Burkholderiales bacterium]
MIDVKGTSMVERAGAAPRILGSGEQLDQRDTISVARDSWAILEFSDQTRITLRPNTVFRIDAWRAGTPESALMGLVRGGLRVVTGFISKRDTRAMQVVTSVATIGIRGTEFDARLCEQDCAQEERLHPAPLRALAAARVVEMKGVAAVTRSGEAGRLLVPGAALFEGDGIATRSDSYAVLVFRDGSRVTLGAGSWLAIAAYRFDENKRTGHALLFHAEGRALVQTGAIAKQGPEFYRFISPMGEIRPRGTGFWSQATSAAQSTAQSTGDAGQAAKDEADRRAAEEAAKVAAEAARIAAAAKAGADRAAAAAAAEAARLAAEAERLAAEAAAAAQQVAKDPNIVFGGVKPGAGLLPQTPASAIDLAALAASEASRAAAEAETAARAAAAAAAAEAERLAAEAAVAAERVAKIAAAEAYRKKEAALMEKRRAQQEERAAKLRAAQEAARVAEEARIAAEEADRLAAEAKLKAEQDAAAAKLKIAQNVARAENFDFIDNLYLYLPLPPPPAGPGTIPVPYPNLPPHPFRTSSPEKEPDASNSSESSVAVWDGEVDIIKRGTVKSGEILAHNGKLGLIDFGRLHAGEDPRPDLVKIDPGIFGGEPKPIDAGLYVWVRDGEVSLTKDDKSVDVPKGNAAVATRDDVKLLDAVPNFMRFDPTPLPVLSLTAKLDAFKLPDGALQNMCVIR